VRGGGGDGMTLAKTAKIAKEEKISLKTPNKKNIGS
jgi:hypothetical protein